MKILAPFKYSCRAVRPELWDFVAERLPESTLERVESHLAKCDACRKEVATLQKAQVALLDARLEEPPAPQRGWADLQARLEKQEVGVGLASRVAPATVTWETNRQEQRTLALRRAPNMMLMGSCAMLLLSTFVTYRTLSLRQEGIASAPVIMNARQEARSDAQQQKPVVAVHSKREKDTLSSPLPSEPPTMIAASAKSKTPKSSKPTQTAKKSQEKPTNDLTGYQVMPAGYQDNPEINVPTPSTSTLKFSRHTPEPSEKAQEKQKEPEYVMGVLTPVAHEKDAY